ncbi:MAG: prolyl oligopeptidase family serine peptidase [Bryobacteraceae bacterium]
MKIRRRVFLPLIVCAALAPADEFPYQKPPKEILDVLHAPAPPVDLISPTRGHVLLVERELMPPIAELARPMYRLAGLRINPANNGRHLPASTVTGLTVLAVESGARTRVSLPAGVRFTMPAWSPDGKRFALLGYTPAAVELYLGAVDSSVLRRVPNLRIDDTIDGIAAWWAGSTELLVRAVPTRRGAPPPKPAAPAGPNVQESAGQAGPVRTFQDMLTSPYDEKLFEHYCTSQLVLVNADTLRTQAVGEPKIFLDATPSPDGQFVLVEWIHRPFSYLHPYTAFPRETEVWDRAGKLVRRIHSAPLQDRLPIEGVPVGPRNVSWRPDQPATLLWWEALDDGDPRRKVPHRDRLMTLKAPFTETAQEVYRTRHRARGLQVLEKGGVALVTDYDRDRRWVETARIFLDNPSAAPKVIWSRNVQDRYRDPGMPVMKTLANGARVVHQSGDWIFLSGPGATPQGERPFLDRFRIETGESERLFRAGEKGYEAFAALLAEDGSRFLTRFETPDSPPNLSIRTRGSDERRALTDFKDTTPQLRGIRQQLVTYKRKDGVQLSFTLMLPPGYREGERLPTILWAYPLEYTDADTAGQIGGSTQRYVQMRGASHLFLLLQGYAILNNATIPIVGDPETVNNTYVEQLILGAEAAIDKAVEMGVTDRDRVGVSGHSYGAFMTANLLAHTRLFKAGVARSGAYNRTLTPFGFQSERRTFWQARDIYIKMSPFTYADQIKDPLLLIHGEADNNPGTFPIQSERMYQAVRGNGGTVRLVMLPHESHGYLGRESVEHVIWEMLTWFDRYVKNAGRARPSE